MASRVSVEPAKLLATLKNTVFKGATDDELLALVVTANEYQLNPILKEMYAFPQKGGGIVPVVGIDGWLKIINRQKNFDGLSVEVSPDGQEATCRIHLKDRAHPVEVTEYLSECSRGTEPWRTMPKRMLRHKAIIQAARVAFGIGGIHDEDEARDIAHGMRNVTPQTPTENPFIESPRGESNSDAVQCVEDPAPTVGGQVQDSTQGAGSDTAKKKTTRTRKAQEPPSQKVRAFIESHATKAGETNGKPWTLHTVELNIDGQVIEATTFSDTLGGLAEWNVERLAEVEIVDGKNGKEIVALEIVEEGGDA